MSLLLLLLPQISDAQANLPYAEKAGRDLQYLTSPALAGRGYGPADGARRAAHYITRRFRELGLEPMGDSAGQSYYQHFTLPVNTFPGPMALKLGKQTLRPGYDFIAAPDCPSIKRTGRAVVFDTSWFRLDSATILRRLRPHSLQGKMLVLRARDEKQLAKLPLAVRQWTQTAAAILIREPKKLTASLAPRQARQPWVRILDSAWQRGPVPRRISLQVTAQLESAYPAMNVLGRRRGSSTSDSVLIVSAHYDHLGQQGPEVTFFGANDNASGTAMLLALADQLRNPRHDILFMAFGAEEAGLIGSQWNVAHPPIPLSRIRFLLNLDLEGFGDGATVVNATLHKRQFQRLDSLNRVLHGASFPLRQRGRAANSDHYPFSERGVSAFFLYSLGGPGYYHDVRDRAPTLQLSRAERVYRLVEAFLRALDAQP